MYSLGRGVDLPPGATDRFTTDRSNQGPTKQSIAPKDVIGLVA